MSTLASDVAPCPDCGGKIVGVALHGAGAGRVRVRGYCARCYSQGPAVEHEGYADAETLWSAGDPTQYETLRTRALEKWSKWAEQ